MADLANATILTVFVACMLYIAGRYLMIRRLKNKNGVYNKKQN